MEYKRKLLNLMCIVVFYRTSKKSSSKKSSKNAEVPTYTSPYTAKDFRASALTNGGVTNVSSGFAGVPKIPRAMPNNNSWDRGSNLEMTESGSRQALVTRGDKGGVRTSGRERGRMSEKGGWGRYKSSSGQITTKILLYV